MFVDGLLFEERVDRPVVDVLTVDRMLLVERDDRLVVHRVDRLALDRVNLLIVDRLLVEGCLVKQRKDRYIPRP